MILMQKCGYKTKIDKLIPNRIVSQKIMLVM